MIRKIIYTSIVILSIACNSKRSSNKMEHINADFEFNKSITLTGVYVKSIISKRGQGDHIGHYKIITDRLKEVILLPPYLKESVRSKEEVQSFEGKKVEVTGVIRENTSLSPPSLENQPISVNIPCFITIESIRLAK